MSAMPQISFLMEADAEALLTDVAARLRSGSIVPYLGPGSPSCPSLTCH